jgi:trans-2,3-dihydro-3-hydroxyanthranilate isomerase
MTHRFIICDVFTDRAFGGNQLAVFPDAGGIGDAEMQAYARELNFSETTFVLPPRRAGHTHRVRIFTPTKEIPFAGHPNVGTAVVLAHLEREAASSFVFDEDVGTVAVEATAGDLGGSAELTIRRAVEIRSVDVPRHLLAGMVSLPEDRLGDLTPWAGSLGIPFFCLPLAHPDAVASAIFDAAAWQRTLPEGVWARDVYAVAGDFAPGGRLKVRMWAPADGVPEDPATGSAAAMLVGSLAARLPEPEGNFAWTIEQGAELGRPSVIEASAEKREGEVVAIRVGGGVAIVAEGSFYSRRRPAPNSP